jgi:esterase/lipase
LDIEENYQPADRSLEIAANERTAIYGWSIGGVLLGLCFIATSIAICCFCYKVKTGCVSAIKPFLEVKSQSKKDTMEELLRAQMEDFYKWAASQGLWSYTAPEENKLGVESLEMSTHASRSAHYPQLPASMHYTGGGVTPVRATAPLEAKLVQGAPGTLSGVETTIV